MKERTKDLNEILFDQLERLNDKKIKGDELKQEIDRADAMGRIAGQLINNGKLILEAVRVSENAGLELPEYFDTETKPRKNRIASQTVRRPLLRSDRDDK